MRPDGLTARDGGLSLAVHLPWYRSLPVSCLEALDVPGRAGDVHDIELGLAVRIPYMQQAPGVPLVQRAAVRTEATVR